jgi:heme-degrading monooxygenase HmoA
VTLAATPDPPYTAVIFTSLRGGEDPDYARTADEMERLASEQPGYLGIESVREADVGITVSYWTDAAAARDWKAVAEHRVAQRLGRDRWYQAYRVRIATVEREYGHP